MSRSLSHLGLRAGTVAPALALAFSLVASTALAHEVKRAAAPSAATQTAPAPPAALAALDGLHDALGRGDTTAALARLADDVLIYEQGGAERSKAEYASHHLGSDAEFAKATRRQLTTRRSFAAGDLAVVTSETRTTGRFRERDVDSLGKETAVLRQSGGDWRIVHVHWSSQKAPPKP
ncbi:MAG TPA: nuclear transport factor 2 family protein [Caulobacteraceae bacterium]|jgi:ketosteroid isomerase-like protein